jgi:hypothetical protein
MESIHFFFILFFSLQIKFTIHLLIFAFDTQQKITFNVSCSARKCSTKSVTQQSFSFSLFLLSIGSCVI